MERSYPELAAPTTSDRLASPASSLSVTIGAAIRKQLPLPEVSVGVAVVLGGALLLACVTNGGYWLLPLAIAPLYLMYEARSLGAGRIDMEQQAGRSAELHLATIEALARAIDAKQPLSHNHPWRVQFLAARLAQALGLPEEEVRGIKTAALLHDIGKLAVPEHILSKPGPLTKEEFDTVRIHSQIGAEIIAGVPFPYPVAAAILSHHERWDGCGYPHQLKGDAIPLGARILAIVDCFDSAVSERPYHKPRAYADVAELIAREGGAALDPRLVTTFVGLLPSLLADIQAQEQHGAWDSRPAADSAAAPSAGSATMPPAGVFENIALAHGEIYALYEIAQSMSTTLGVADTMALISSKLSKIVPWSGCSLFVYNRGLDALTGAFSAGLDAPELINRTVANHEGLADWVGGLRRTLVSVDPRSIPDAGGPDGGTELRSALVCPLFFEQTFVGVFSAYHVDAERYTEDHRRLFERVAELTGTALHNSLVFEQTQRDALTDQLTRLPNRRWLSRYLPQELSRAERPPAEVALIAIDIDDFKSINDSYGHDVGDRALRAVADALLAVCRPYDVCARHAGDEFVVVLPNCSREAAEARREELQQCLGDIDIEVSAEVRLRLGASAGVSVFPHDGHTCEALHDVADRRMYRDKTARNRARPAGSQRIDHTIAQPLAAAAGAAYVEAALSL